MTALEPGAVELCPDASSTDSDTLLRSDDFDGAVFVGSDLSTERGESELFWFQKTLFQKNKPEVTFSLSCFFFKYIF